jgi:hypothetical protein
VSRIPGMGSPVPIVFHDAARLFFARKALEAHPTR